MKSTFKFIFYLVIFVIVINYIKRDGRGDSPGVDFTETSQTTSLDRVSDRGDNQARLNSVSDVLIIIRPLGDIDEGDLEFAAKIVKNFYKWEVVFKSEISIKHTMLNEDGHLQTINTFGELVKTENERTLFITDKLLYDHTGLLLRGAAFSDYLVIVRGERGFMEETIIHEIGHLLGLEHCDNLSCIMAINNDEWETGDFCRECKNKINF